MKRTKIVTVFVFSLIILFSSGCSRFSEDAGRDDYDREDSSSAEKDDEAKNDADGKIKLGDLFGKTKEADSSEAVSTESALDEAQNTETTAEAAEPEQSTQNAETTAEAAEPVQSTEAALAESDFILPYSDTRLLSYEDIADLTIEEIPYARNEIYARHGYPFQKESYIAYFGSKDWYRINPDFKESDLSEIEKANVEFLKGYEQR